MSNPAKQKVFLALWPDQQIRNSIDTIARQVDRGGKPVPARNLHITLVFIGYVDQEGLQCVQKVAARTTSRPFTLNIDRLGSFKNRVLWLGCQQVPDTLIQLQHSLTTGLQQTCDYQPEKRRYSPHITLQRKIKEPVSSRLDSPVTWEIKNFSLILSEPGKTSPKYSEIGRWTLEME